MHARKWILATVTAATVFAITIVAATLLGAHWTASLPLSLTISGLSFPVTASRDKRAPDNLPLQQQKVTHSQITNNGTGGVSAGNINGDINFGRQEPTK